MLNIAVIVGSTRESRFAMKPSNWILDIAKKRDDMNVELLDLQDFDLPFFNEVASNAWAPTQSENAVKWQKKLAEFDGYVFVTAEYNRSITGALKNALDQAYVEWNRKPMGIVSYGSVGGTRAAEHLRMIGVELQMVPVRSTVAIGGAAFMKVHPMGEDGPMSEIEDAVLGSANSMLDDMVWWGNATKTARAESEQSEAA
jgi:NAD(P)H-dependent FMN reductase